MLDHLSYSAVRSFFTCPQSFKKCYILKEQMPDKKVYAIGKAWHYGLELMYRNEYDQSKVLSFLTENPCVDDTDDITKLLDNLETYKTEYLPTIGFKTHSIECRLNGTPFSDSLPITGVIDVLTEDFNVIDHKYVSKYEEDTSKYAVQSWFYYELIKINFGKTPSFMRIDEFKKSSNRDKTPQLRSLYINYNEKEMERIGKWYQGASYVIQNTKYFLPNPFAAFDNESFKQYLYS